MSPVGQIKHMAHRAHVAQMHMVHSPFVLRMEKMLSTPQFWVLALVVILLGIMFTLALWASTQGGTPTERFYNPIIYGP